MNKSEDVHRNRRAGEIFEEYVINQFRSKNVFPELGRTSKIDPQLDAVGIDLITIDREDKKFKFTIQCKNTTKSVDYETLLRKLSKVSKGIPVVFHRKTQGTAQQRFITKGEYAILNFKDFLDLITLLEKYKEGYREYSKYFDSIYPDEQKKLHKKLEELGI